MQWHWYEIVEGAAVSTMFVLVPVVLHQRRHLRKLARMTEEVHYFVHHGEPHPRLSILKEDTVRQKLNITGSISIGLPTTALIVLALIAGAAQAINVVVLEVSPTWHTLIAAGIVFISSFGGGPLLGPAFKAALHLPMWANSLISGAMAFVVVLLSTLQMTTTTHWIIASVLTVLSMLGFAPSNAEPALPLKV